MITVSGASCPSCKLAKYCSHDCQRQDMQHQPGGPLCGVAWPVLLPGEAVLAVHIARLANRPSTFVHEACYNALRDTRRQRHNCWQSKSVASLETHWRRLALDQAHTLVALACLATACHNLSLEKCSLSGNMQLVMQNIVQIWILNHAANVGNLSAEW